MFVQLLSPPINLNARVCLFDCLQDPGRHKVSVLRDIWSTESSAQASDLHFGGVQISSVSGFYSNQ